MEIKIIAWIIASILSGIEYRLGGIGKPFNTKYRDIGCSFTALILWWILVGFKLSLWWAYLLFFLLTFGSLTTYFKKEKVPAKWWNWCLVGLAWGISALPLALVYNYWLGFTLRTVFLVLTVYLCSEFNGDVTKEELGRGVLLTLSMPLLLI